MSFPTQRPAAQTVSFRGMNGLRLAADRWWATEPQGTVFLLHGGGQTRHSWHGAGDRLCKAGWNTVSLDARGHGDSEWAADRNYRHDALVGDLLAVIDQVGDGPPVVVGASMGGITGLVAAGEHPGAIRALVLVDIVPRLEKAGVDRISSFMRAAPDGFASLEEVAEAVHAYNPRRKRPATIEGLKKNVRQHENGRWYWHWDPGFMRPVEEMDEPNRALGYDRMMSAARRIDVPTLLIRGRQSDIVSMAGVEELLAAVPSARFVDITGAGHMVAGDDNDVFGAAVVDFINHL